MKYIDAEKLVAEIKRMRQAMIEQGEQKDLHDAEIIRRSVISACNDLLNFAGKVEMDEDTFREEFHAIDRQCFEEGIAGWQREKLIARHFYELGLNARK